MEHSYFRILLFDDSLTQDALFPKSITDCGHLCIFHRRVLFPNIEEDDSPKMLPPSSGTVGPNGDEIQVFELLCRRDLSSFRHCLSEDGPFDIVIMNWELCGEHGVDLICEIRLGDFARGAQGTPSSAFVVLYSKVSVDELLNKENGMRAEIASEVDFVLEKLFPREEFGLFLDSFLMKRSGEVI